MGQGSSSSKMSKQEESEKSKGAGYAPPAPGTDGPMSSAPPPYSPLGTDPSSQGASAPPPGAYEPPPSYSATLADGSSSTVGYTGCIEQQMFQQRYMQEQMAAYPQSVARVPAGAVVHGEFDAGARFSKVAPPSLPPPPPGVPPTPAQIAAMRGGTVIMNQKKETFLNGTGHGGSTLF